MLILNKNGQVQTIEFLDINVFGHAYTDDGKIELSLYESYYTDDGYLTTNTMDSLVHLKTDLDPDLWGEDEWYGFGDETAPGDIPGDILALVRPYILREYGSDSNPILAYARRHPGENILYKDLPRWPSDFEISYARNILARLANARRAV